MGNSGFVMLVGFENCGTARSTRRLSAAQPRPSYVPQSPAAAGEGTPGDAQNRSTVNAAVVVLMPEVLMS